MLVQVDSMLMVELVIEFYEQLHINLHVDHTEMILSKIKNLVLFLMTIFLGLLHFHMFLIDYQHFDSVFAFDILQFLNQRICFYQKKINIFLLLCGRVICFPFVVKCVGCPISPLGLCNVDCGLDVNNFELIER